MSRPQFSVTRADLRAGGDPRAQKHMVLAWRKEGLGPPSPPPVPPLQLNLEGEPLNPWEPPAPSSVVQESLEVWARAPVPPSPQAAESPGETCAAKVDSRGAGGETLPAWVTWASCQQCHAQRQGWGQLQRIPAAGFCSAVESHVFSKQYPNWDPLCVRRSLVTMVRAGRGVQRPPRALHLSCSLPMPWPDSGGPDSGRVICPVRSCPASPRSHSRVPGYVCGRCVPGDREKILYISDQVASIFRCKRDAFYNAKFVEFLAPHGVVVFPRLHHARTSCRPG